jgi:hypothetical protein
MDTSREFASRLASLLRREQRAMADFLLALADFDRCRLWVELGYTSLFYFLHRALKLSAGAAFHRKTAAELIQRFPEVIEPLRDGRLCLSSIVELSKVMKPENMAEILPRLFHASKQEARAVAAELAPREVLPQRVVVTAVGPPSQARAAASRQTEPRPLAPTAALEVGQAFHLDETPRLPVRDAAPAMPSVSPPPSPRSAAEPLTADLRRLHVTVSKKFLEKLEAARDALSHSRPGADVEAILEEGLDLVIERAAKRKGLVKRPRTQRLPVASVEAGEEDSRAIPAAVKREVWLRDGGRCQWPTADGGVCGSTQRVQFDHVVPVARGGKSTADNMRLACAVHNDLAARQAFGDAWMDRFSRGLRQPSLPAAPA